MHVIHITPQITAERPAAANEALRLIREVMQRLDHDPAARTCLDEAHRLLAGPAAVVEDATSDAGQASSGGLAPWQLRLVDRCVERRLTDRLRVHDLAAEARLSQRHFSRAFKRSMGMSPHVFLTLRRLDRACRLMAETHDTLADIADACGLADQAHLTRLFRSHFRQTPRQWRRANALRDARPACLARDVDASFAA